MYLSCRNLLNSTAKIVPFPSKRLRSRALVSAVERMIKSAITRQNCKLLTWQLRETRKTQKNERNFNKTKHFAKTSLLRQMRPKGRESNCICALSPPPCSVEIQKFQKTCKKQAKTTKNTSQKWLTLQNSIPGSSSRIWWKKANKIHPKQTCRKGEIPLKSAICTPSFPEENEGNPKNNTSTSN